MKKVTLTVAAVVCLGLISANVWANCGTCAAKPAPKCATAKCAQIKCPMGGILSKLDLTADQKAKIDEICKAADCPKDPPKDKKARKACAKQRKKCMGEIKKILTPEQQKKWAKLKKAAKKNKPKKDKKAKKAE